MPDANGVHFINAESLERDVVTFPETGEALGEVFANPMREMYGREE